MEAQSEGVFGDEMFERYEFCPADETQSWRVRPARPRAWSAATPVPDPRVDPLATTPSAEQPGLTVINRPLRRALQLLRHQLPKDNLWLEEQVKQLAGEVARNEARRQRAQLG